MELCCSSLVSAASIWATCDCVALICDWFGAGPGRVVDVVCGAAAAKVTFRKEESNDPAKAATRIARVPPLQRAVIRQFAAPTGSRVLAGPLQMRDSCVAEWLRPRSRTVHPRGRRSVTIDRDHVRSYRAVA